MATFQANFLDGSNVPQVYGENGIIYAEDTTNYGMAGSSGDGHDLIDFDLYRRMELDTPDGGTLIRSSLDEEGTSHIDPASRAVSLEETFDISDWGDWDYTVRLYTVPTYDPTVTYAENDCVYVADEGLYKARRATVGDTPLTSTDDWMPVLDPDDLSLKYKATLRWAVTYDTEVGWMRMVNLANRDTTGRDMKFLPNNLYYLTALKLNLILDAVIGLAEVTDWEGVRFCIGEAKEILSHANSN